MLATVLSVLRLMIVLTAVNLIAVGISVLVVALGFTSTARATEPAPGPTAALGPTAAPRAADDGAVPGKSLVLMQQPAAAKPEFTPRELALSRVYRRAVEAAIWGMPIVSVHAMRQAFFRDAGADYGDILYFSKPADWRFQTATPNPSSLYVYFNFNTNEGPIVLEFPAANGAHLSGSLINAWQTPLADVGPDGEDRGRGGKYLLLPPGYAQDVPADYIPLHFETYNGYALFRAIPETTSEEDVSAAIGLVKRLRLYRLATAAQRPEQRFIDIAGISFDGIPRYDDTFYDRLARMVDEEPVQTRDLVAMALLRSLGIEKGKAFAPDESMREVLKAAATEAHAGFMQAAAIGGAFWPGRQWILSAVVGPRTGFRYETADRLDIDERGTTFFLAHAAPKRLSDSTFYTGAYRDSEGELLSGDKVYRLRVPPDVPVRQHWAVTVYDLTTAGFMRGAPRLAIESNDQDVRKNPDGSVDVYFASGAPPGHRANWIYTEAGKPWFTFFSFHGPERAVSERTWQLPDIEPIGSAGRALE